MYKFTLARKRYTRRENEDERQHPARDPNEFRINPALMLLPISHRNALVDTTKWLQRINVTQEKPEIGLFATRQINLLMNKPGIPEFRTIVIQ